MKIFDCFMYFDEELVLDLRLNTLNEYVDYFVIIESNFTHKGDKRDLKFNHSKFSNFKDAYQNTREHILSGKTSKHLKNIQSV